MNGRVEDAFVLERSVSAVVSAAGAIPERGGLAGELAAVEQAARRGYFLPDEEEKVRSVYAGYLGLRAGLLETLADVEAHAGRGGIEWKERLPFFVTAFAAACLVLRADRFVVDVAADCPVLWKKLDEEDPRTGIPRKTFTAIFKALSHPANTLRFLAAVDFYFSNRGEILGLRSHPMVGPVVDLLAREEEKIEKGRRKAVKRFWRYRLFSFLRRNRSAWKKAVFGLFEASGRAVADLRQPGLKPRGAAKRIHAGLRTEVLRRVGPGDVFVTRHDDALSNLFLPGFWPHAALYLGTERDLDQLGISVPAGVEADGWFLESKKDGVRIRPAWETLEVDAFVVLKHPFSESELAEAIARAVSHVGKPYDFVFDFRTADRMVCTEVIYRGFHGIGPAKFRLKEVGGRLCLPAEEFLDQALGCGYQISATGGLGGDGLLIGDDCLEAFQKTHPRGR